MNNTTPHLQALTLQDNVQLSFVGHRRLRLGPLEQGAADIRSDGTVTGRCPPLPRSRATPAGCLGDRLVLDSGWNATRGTLRVTVRMPYALQELRIATAAGAPRCHPHARAILGRIPMKGLSLAAAYRWLLLVVEAAMPPASAPRASTSTPSSGRTDSSRCPSGWPTRLRPEWLIRHE